MRGCQRNLEGDKKNRGVRRHREGESKSNKAREKYQ